jgi:hypothetical protein
VDPATCREPVQVVPRVTCVVTLPDGAARRVGPNGLLIGRKHDCDLVSEDPSVSRRHALLRLTMGGAEIVPLGKGWFEVNGERHHQPHALHHGDRIAVPGLILTVEMQATVPDRGEGAAWRFVRALGGSFGVSHSPFLIGGDKTDDLIVKRWPKATLQVHVAQGELYLDAAVDHVTKNGIEVDVDTMEPLVPGDQIGFKGETFTIAHASLARTTVANQVSPLPHRVVIEILPRGGRAVFSVGDREYVVLLAERRLDLLIALLRPPPGMKAGDFIADEVVAQIVWPRNDDVTRSEMNVLLSRLRRDFVQAGLAGFRLIERAPGGRGTRFLLAPGAEISVES